MKPARCLRPAQPLRPSPNPFCLLQDDTADPTPAERLCQWTEKELQTSHEAWCHPGHSKFDEILGAHPEHFPKDPAFRTAAHKLWCPVCDLVKGSRKYRKSARMKLKQARKQTATSSILRDTVEAEVPTALSGGGAARVYAAHRDHRRVRFAPDTASRSRLADDDFLHAFQPC